MSLINIKNFVQPVIDKRNLVTIILIAGLFGIIRLSGGKAGMAGSPRQVNDSRDRSTLGSMEAPTQIKNTSRTQEMEVAESREIKVKPKSKGVEHARGGDPLIDGVIADTSRPEPKKKPVKPTNGRLDDIEETLGMR